MKIAVTYQQDGTVFQHFGQTEQFKVYEIRDKKVHTSVVMGSDGSGHGALAGFLKGKDVDAVICGGIGEGAKRALAEASIALYGGVMGEADQAVAELLTGKLLYHSGATCDHDEHRHHHGGEHSCGGHHGQGHAEE